MQVPLLINRCRCTDQRKMTAISEGIKKMEAQPRKSCCFVRGGEMAYKWRFGDVGASRTPGHTVGGQWGQKMKGDSKGIDLISLFLCPSTIISSKGKKENKEQKERDGEKEKLVLKSIILLNIFLTRMWLV